MYNSLIVKKMLFKFQVNKNDEFLILNNHLNVFVLDKKLTFWHGNWAAS